MDNIKVLDDISKITHLEIKYTQTTAPKKYDVTIMPISQKILQIAFVKQQIYNMVKIDKIEPSQIAVVLPNESFSSILSLFDNEQYFNFAMGINISQTKIVQNIKTINKLLTNYEPNDKDKLDFFDIDSKFFDFIKQNWHKNISKEQFIKKFCHILKKRVIFSRKGYVKSIKIWRNKHGNT